MVQATQLAYFNDASIARQLRSSWFWSVFGQHIAGAIRAELLTPAAEPGIDGSMQMFPHRSIEPIVAGHKKRCTENRGFPNTAPAPAGCTFAGRFEVMSRRILVRTAAR